MTDQPSTRDEDNAALTDEALEEELTIAAYGTDDDREREDRFDGLLEEHEHRTLEEQERKSEQSAD